ncbi:EamA family transporter [Curtobacterium sp. APC 4022]|uniref:EamA family transporter n=1 Tax=Curtobacterium sp. APC 4022 TaxID=3035201 RepID=UPI0025B3B629|nr:EamA family transporter [Curtobacterium sp. APC 4022]MDN3479109.1 EamA family transporter [Curtobacterium sp. APC 4022]
MITVLLGLGGALVYGAADFLGGLASRRVRPVRVAAVAALVGLVPLLVGFAVLGGRFSEQAVVAGVVAGLSGAVGVLLLYAALAIGPMSVLSPLTAVFSAVVPVVVALVRGIVLSPLGVVALVVAVVAVVLVAAVPDPGGARLTLRGVVTAAVAGCGFGGVVLGYDASPPDSGVATLLVARTLQVVLLGAAALVTLRLGGRVGTRPGGTPAATTTPDVRPVAGRVRPGRVRPGRALVLVVIGCGVFDAMANVFIQAGLHSSDDPSTLPVISVLNALYPIGTVVLAGIVLRERLTALQTTGIVLAFAASVGLAVS